MDILLFGIAKEIVGDSVLATDIPPAGIKVRDLKQQLLESYPAFKNLASMAIAVNSEYAEDDWIIKEKDEVVFIPPVSGG